jgi:hypothetical protein
VNALAELIARAVYEKARPNGVPWPSLKQSERDLWIAGGHAAVAAIWSIDPV